MFFAFSPYHGHFAQPNDLAARPEHRNRVQQEVAPVNMPNAMAEPQAAQAPVNLRNISLTGMLPSREGLTNYAHFAIPATIASLSLGLMLGATTARSTSIEDSRFNVENFGIVTLGGIIVSHVARGICACMEREDDREDNEMANLGNAHNPIADQQDETPESLTTLNLPDTLSAAQLERAQKVLDYGLDQDFPLKKIEYDQSDVCPITLKETMPSAALHDTDQNNEEDFIQQPVLIQNETGRGYSAVFERNDLITSWILTGEDPTSRQQINLDTLRTAEIITSDIAIVDMTRLSEPT